MDKKTYVQLKAIKNSYFKKDMLTLFLKKELFISKLFKNIKFLGIKNQNQDEIHNTIERLRKIDNVYIDDKAKDIYYKTRSIGCTYCTMGKGCTVVLSYKCHRNCFFCYEESPLDPKVVIDPYKKEDIENIYNMIDTSFSNPNNKTLAITGGEPLLFKDKLYEILEYVNKHYPGKHIRIYTTGDMMDKETLLQLQAQGVDEIRYSIKPGEMPNLSLYALTKKYISTVMIEMPVQPNSKDYMIDIMSRMSDDGNIDGINLNELTFNNLNPEKFKQVGYLLDIANNNQEIYHRYHDASKVEIGVYGSKLLCLELLEYFAKEKSNFFIHYCDLDTVSIHQYLQKIQNAQLVNNSYSTITKFGLHKVLRVYTDLDSVSKTLVENDIVCFKRYPHFIETKGEYLPLLQEKEYQMAMIYKNHDYRHDVDADIINM